MNTATVLADAMSASNTSQSELARLSGVRQPSISQIVSGHLHASDQQLARLLACMGYRLEVERRATPAELTRAESRSWRLHRHLARTLDADTLLAWRPRLDLNLERLARSVRGEPHLGNLARWEQSVRDSDLGALKRRLTGLDRLSIEMREVSPFSGLLPDEVRRRILLGVD